MFKFCAADIETTGVDPQRCQVLEVGAVIADIAGNTYSTFHYFIEHPTIMWDTDKHGKQVAREMNEARYNHELASAKATRQVPWKHKSIYDFHGWVEASWFNYAFAQWLTKCGYRSNYNNKLTIAGKNFGSFDWQFLNHGFGLSDYLYAQKIYTTRRFIDPAMLYFDPTVDEALPDMTTCLQRAGFNKPVTHNALDDAMDVVKVLARYYVGSRKRR